ncbi:Uncharacterised protein [Vibrio cholerae]|nr:Uncharacterised protein [Vibrio cholerae]
MQQCTEFAHQSKYDGRDCRPSHDRWVKCTSQHHGTSHFTVCGVGWRTKHGCGHGRDPVTSDSAV